MRSVRSGKVKKPIKPIKILKQIDKFGYKYVRLIIPKNGKMYEHGIPVQILMARAYPEHFGAADFSEMQQINMYEVKDVAFSAPIIFHKDTDTSNNCLSNLVFHRQLLQDHELRKSVAENLPEVSLYPETGSIITISRNNIDEIKLAYQVGFDGMRKVFKTRELAEQHLSKLRSDRLRVSKRMVRGHRIIVTEVKRNPKNQ